MIKYEIEDFEISQMVKRIEPDGKVWWIPMDEANSDYQRYLRWLENPNAEEQGGLI